MENFNLIKRFSENCSAHSDDTAIIDVRTDTSMSYHELDVASGKVYRYLTEHGIGREDVVMIFLPRGARPFITIVGVWKAGAAYVMLETDYPAEKLEFIKHDTNCKLIIDESVFEEMMQGDVLQGYKVADPHDLSYIIYTSGTTGNPKGVMHEYGTIGMDIATWQYAGRPLFGQTDNFIQLTPLNFTATIILFHVVIYAGAALTTVPIETVKNINRLLAVMNKNGITAGFFTPSLFRLLPKLPDSMTKAFVGGEKAQGIFAEGVTVYNMYASSESGMVLLSYRLEDDIENVPLGKPNIEEACVCLLDENGRAVNDGEEGELCFKNPYFRGYLGLPDKNAAVFRDGFIRSGDLAKILPDGNYQIIGRTDDMFKINGNRVESAEIEAAVKQALGTEWVGVRNLTEGNNDFICAYYIGEPVLSIDEAKKIISEKLVSYMQPAFYTKIDKIPINANGKFQRNQLPAPDISAYKKEYVAPTNEMEERLCDAFASVLGIERVGVTDDFYEIGGNSINAIKLVSQMDLEMLDVNMLFVGHTPQKIAELYEEAAREESKKLDECNVIESTKERPISKQQQYILFYQSRYPDSIMWNLPMLLKLGQDTDFERLKKAIDTAFKNHPAISIEFAYNEENQLVQKYDENKIFDTKIEEISEADFAKEKENLTRAFVIIGNPMYHVRLFRTECGGYLFMEFHHSISDGTSLHVVLKDICLAYDQKPLEPDHYFAFFEDKKKKQNSPLYEEGREYYNNFMKKYKWDSVLKTDFTTQENTFGSITEMIPLAPCHYDKLQEEYGLGKNAFYIAVTAMVLSAYNKSDDIKVAWVYSGRETARSQHIVGEILKYFFVGIRFGEIETSGALLKETARQVKNNVKYACYPYPDIEEIIENSDDINLLYQSDIYDFEAEGTLKFTSIDLSGQADGADNLLDVKIIDTPDGCELCLDYNACVYKKESIERFGKMFIKAACMLAENIDKPEMKVAEIMRSLD